MIPKRRAKGETASPCECNYRISGIGKLRHAIYVSLRTWTCDGFVQEAEWQEDLSWLA
jgi:hypothetical protein